MAAEQNTRSSQTGDKPLAETGNASNASPHNADMEPINDNRLLSGEAEKYLREAGNIEDMPDGQDEAEADEVIASEGA